MFYFMKNDYSDELYEVKYTCKTEQLKVAMKVMEKYDAPTTPKLVKEFIWRPVQINLYGKYSQVIPLFKNKLQPELIERYKSDSVKALPFGIGYNMVYKESNLQVLFR